MSKIVTLDEWIGRFKKVHGDKYDYSKVEYVDSKTKVCIICPEHGEFWQTPNNHSRGYGCPLCGLKKVREAVKRKNLNAKLSFIEKAKQIHGNKYDYSKTEYKDAKTKVCIICPEHGEFWQIPNVHLYGHGCALCDKSHKINTEEFIKRAKIVHGDKYNYSKTKYINNKKNVCIICPEHGEFWQRPNDHLSGHGCYKCNCHNQTKDFNSFYNIAKQVHCNKYKYDETTYVNRKRKMKIFCPEHGEFWQCPSNHLSGNGCPFCGNKNNISEQKIFFNLKKKFSDEDIIYQYRNHNLFGAMSLDFYLPKYKIAIEHQGIQHFEPVKKFGGKENLKKTIERDSIKRKICNDNGISILYVSLDKKTLKYSNNEMHIISSIEELIDKIKKCINGE